VGVVIFYQQAAPCNKARKKNGGFHNSRGLAFLIGLTLFKIFLFWAVNIFNETLQNKKTLCLKQRVSTKLSVK